MNLTPAIGRLAGILAGLAGAAAAVAVGVPAALAPTLPGRTWLLSWPDPPLPPGWNKHPPLPDPARLHAALAGGMPGWQITLIAAAAILAAAAAVLLARTRAARRRAAASPA